MVVLSKDSSKERLLAKEAPKGEIKLSTPPTPPVSWGLCVPIGESRGKGTRVSAVGWPWGRTCPRLDVRFPDAEVKARAWGVQTLWGEGDAVVS